MNRIKPGQHISNLKLTKLDKNTWPNDSVELPRYYLLSIYRGLQCSHCKKTLQALDAAMPELRARGIDVIAASADNWERAKQAAENWNLNNLPLAYDFDIDLARQLGLYISTSIRPQEMPVFTEPGLFLIQPDQRLFAAWISSYPFARPDIDEILNCIDFIESNSRPPRGTE